MADSSSVNSEESGSQQRNASKPKIHENYDTISFNCKCPECDNKKVAYKKWLAAADLQEIFDLNRAFLKGTINYAPYHHGGLHPETIEGALVEPLLKLHDYGLFTWGGQPCTEKGKIEELDPGRTIGGEIVRNFREERQLAYVQFMIPQQRRTTATKKQIRSFFDALFKVRMIETMVSWPAYVVVDHESFADPTIRFSHESSPLPSRENRSELEQYRYAPSKAELVDAEWQTKNRKTDLHIYGWEDLDDFPKWMLGTYPVLVDCQAAKWDSDFSLENAILEVAQRHLPKVFQSSDREDGKGNGSVETSSAQKGTKRGHVVNAKVTKKKKKSMKTTTSRISTKVAETAASSRSPRKRRS